MSEQINNREYRKKVIKEIISELHQGKSVDDVKKKFEEAFDGVSAMEISEAEQALIAEVFPSKRCRAFVMFMPLFLKAPSSKYIRRLTRPKFPVTLQMC